MLSRRRLLGFAAGSVGTGVFSTVPGLLLLFLLTDVLGVPAGWAAAILVLPKAWDVVLNPIVGSASDREAVRTGRRTRLLTVGAIGVPVCFVLLFAVPIPSGAGAALWVTAAFVAAATAYACFQVPYAALPVEMSPLERQRTRAVAWRMVALTVGILVSGGLAPAIVDALGKDRPAYAVMGLVVAVIVLAAMLTAARSTRWVPSRPGAQSLGLRESFALARGNTLFFLLMSSYVLQALAVATMLAGAAYVATYRLGDYALTSALFVALVGPTALAVPAWNALAGRVRRIHLLITATVVYALGAAAFLPVAGTGSVTGALLLAALLGVCYAALQLFPFALLPDTVLADAGRTGSAQAGAFTGLWTGGETLGFALGPGVYAAVLATGAFRSSTFDAPVTQPDSALAAVLLGFSAVPAVLLLVSLPLLLAYARREQSR